MKYLKFKLFPDGEEKGVTIVDLSEQDAQVLNEAHDNKYGDFKVLFRKATKEDLAKYGKKEEATSDDSGKGDQVTFMGKSEDDYTVKELKEIAEAQEIELKSTKKHDIFVELCEILPDAVS